MSFSEIYREAGRILKENLGTILLTMIVYALIVSIATGVIGAIGTALFKDSILNIITALIIYVITVYFSAGLCSFFQKLSRGEDASMNELFEQRPNLIGLMVPMIVEGVIVGALSAGFAMLTVIALFAAIASPASSSGFGGLSFVGLLFAILAYWITLGFSQIIFIYLDRPEFAGFNTLGESWNMMKGNKLKLFLLMLGISLLCFVISLVLRFFIALNMTLGGILSFIVAIAMVVCIGPFFTLCLCLFYDAIQSGTTRTRNSTGVTDEQQIENIVEEIGKDARGE